MFVKLSCKIADRLEHCGIISKSNRTLYEYGLRQMFATILNILTMLLIGFIMGLAVPAMVYTIAYIPPANSSFAQGKKATGTHGLPMQG